MFVLMIIVFIIGYTFIALEHPLKINKSATSLVLGILMWSMFIMGDPSNYPVYKSFLNHQESHPDVAFNTWIVHDFLLQRLGEIAEILFFLLGAMTIVEIIDGHHGFRLITDRIKSTNKSRLLWIVSILTFFMSAVLDNLTTSIIIITLLRVIIPNPRDRWPFAAMVILAANAGGAWSPIGDVTTIMLWIGEKVSAGTIITQTFLPSLVSLFVPLLILTPLMKGNIRQPLKSNREELDLGITKNQTRFVFFFGVSVLLFVPLFKTITHLPPYLGMLGGLGLMWLMTDLMHKNKPGVLYAQLSAVGALKRVDISTIFFFLGILMAVAAMQTCGQLLTLSEVLETIPLEEPSKYYFIVSIIGVLSAIVDNVPLVAGTMGMYDFPMNHYFWNFLVYAAGTGGSILIIGSAAGVAVMSMEKMDFIWYLKRISGLALTGYAAGCLVYILQQSFLV
ncbi:MAG: sodium:proton antiporter NhaD [Massilibacteroides sp.]|nr:sodium:proton antiporter NhaD [Massilibacteroides sp.]MDD3061567.1 sodium:proton antiporter NhaD [Massilibacteroides sp.]MDD4114564.1 sodium:proton antiporter NhaD [Massilibacteroides sp.]MDD4659144.1 sodium:proton antiporter NhaD [Massilibacteroides sp.]